MPFIKRKKTVKPRTRFRKKAPPVSLHEILEEVLPDFVDTESELDSLVDEANRLLPDCSEGDVLDESEDDGIDIMEDFARKFLSSLRLSLREVLIENWRLLGIESCKLPRGSGCSGSGMDAYMQDKVASVLNEMTGQKVELRTVMEIDNCTKKQEWLLEFSKPEHLYSDVSALTKGNLVEDLVTKSEHAFPGFDMFFYSYGFSCRDFSNENNMSGPYKEVCLQEGVGTSGVTWAGNLVIVKENQPLFLYPAVGR